MKKLFTILITLFFLIVSTQSISAQQLTPFSRKVTGRAQNYKRTTWIKVPMITWGADLVTVHANGDTKRTASGSAFAGQKLKIELFREDDFVNQVGRFLKGEIVYLRGTMGMMNMAADVTEKDQRTRLVIVYQHSWSAGGDALVVKRGIKSVKDLKGKTIAIQAYGPHVDYMTKLLSDAGLTIKDVNLVWTKDLVGPDGDTPMAKLYDKNVDAAFVIIPDALALTSQGTVGTGAEDSARGAAIMLSTKTASRIINDVYAVRKDYFDQNREEVRRFVQAIMIAEEEVRDLYKAKNSRYNKMLSAAAGMILDSTGATVDMEGMAFLDAEMARYDGNVKFFTDQNYPRNFSRLNNEIQTAYIGLGLITRKAALLQGNWDYSAFTGLRYANRVEASRFDADKVSTVVAKKSQQATLDDSLLFSLEIFFQPNQNVFTVDMYKDDFDKVVELASTYGGAIITVEGHSDPMGFLRKKKEGASQLVLKQIKQAAKNLSFSRANEVRKQIINYAATRGITLDPNQFASHGYGITNPKYPVPKTKQQWLDNMRVEFKIIQVEAEEDVFLPLE